MVRCLVRLASHFLHLVLYTFLVTSHWRRRPKVIRTRALSEWSRRFDNDVSPSVTSQLRSLEYPLPPIEHDTEDETSAHALRTLKHSSMDSKASSASLQVPLMAPRSRTLRTIHYTRPLHPFGIVAVLYVFMGFAASVCFLADSPLADCFLGAEAIVLYTMMPFAIYATLRLDARMFQNLVSREDGFGRLAHIPREKIDLEEVLGGGSTGTVYRASYQGMALCAKKYVASVTDEVNLNRLEMETSMLGDLCHPNIVRIVGLCQDRPYFYLLMEYCTGGDLHSYIHNPVKILGYDFAMIFLREIASALQYVHSRGVVHRDLKSLNILIDKEMHVKLADFEVSHFRGTIGAHANRGIAGTLGWLAPELVKPTPLLRQSWTNLLDGCADKTLFACDVYAFGVVMYELFTRKHPPLARHSIAQVCDQPVEVVFNPELFHITHASDGTPLPSKITNLLLRCVAIKPKNRPSFSEIVKLLGK